VSVSKVIAAGLAALAAALAWTIVAQANPTSAGGKIAFARYRFVDSPLRREIWVANPDGSGLRRVSHAPANVLDSNPSWSPDGKRLVFTRCSADESAGCAVWAVNADGTNQHELTTQCPDLLSPSCIGDDGAVYSPRGNLLAFNHGGNPVEIAIADPNFGHMHGFPVPAATPDIGAIAWSPNGRRLVFEARNETHSAVFIANTDGSHLRRLTPWRLKAYNGDQIDWSVSGGILFRSTTSIQTTALPPDGDIYTIHPNGTHLRRLTHLPPGSGLELGSFSPDGRWIVFATSAGAASNGGGTWPDIFRMRIDGTGRAHVTQTRNWEGSPAWGKAQ
jgi:Tol biopolymer transport system component